MQWDLTTNEDFMIKTFYHSLILLFDAQENIDNLE